MKCQNETVTVELKNGELVHATFVQSSSNRDLATEVLLSGASFVKLRKQAIFHYTCLYS